MVSTRMTVLGLRRADGELIVGPREDVRLEAGDRLIVAINSDESVKRLKGPTRPLQNEAARSIVMSSIGVVDRVLLADADPLVARFWQVAAADTQWLIDLEPHGPAVDVDGLLPVVGYRADSLEPEQVAVMEQAAKYGRSDAAFQVRVVNVISQQVS